MRNVRYIKFNAKSILKKKIFQKFVRSRTFLNISKHTYLCSKLYILLLDDDIHSLSSLSYDRSKASSKASSPHSAI
jgi:hypothetical protein